MASAFQKDDSKKKSQEIVPTNNFKLRNIITDERSHVKNDALSYLVTKHVNLQQHISDFQKKECAYVEKAFGRQDMGYLDIPYITNTISHFMPVPQACELVSKAPDLSAIIECYANSISGAGWYMEYIGKEGMQGSSRALKEKENAEFNIRTINYKETINELFYKAIKDKETIAYAYFEIRRNSNGEVAEMQHIPADEMLLYREETIAQAIKVFDYVGDKPKSKYHYHYFKHFVRFPDITGSSVGNPIYYNELGSNTILATTGEIYDSIQSLEKAGATLADEIIAIELYNTGLLSAVPRWASAIEGIQGTFLADELNRDSLENGGMPSMALLVSGGGLDQDSIDEIARSFNGPYKKKQKVIVLEAIGDDGAASETGSIPPPKMEFKPLHDSRQKDAMYQEYIATVSERLLAAYRLSPMMLGRIQDVNYSTAEQAILLIEEQVFKPERKKLEHIVNTMLLLTGKKQTPLKYWRFRLRPTVFMAPDSIVSIMRAGEVAGSMTPNVGIEIMNKYTEMDIEKVSAAWGDYPKDLIAIAASQQREIGLEEIMAPPIDPLKGVQIDNKARAGKVNSSLNPNSGNSDGNVNSVAEALNDVKTAGKVNTNNISLKKDLEDPYEIQRAINDFNRDKRNG